MAKSSNDSTLNIFAIGETLTRTEDGILAGGPDIAPVHGKESDGFMIHDGATFKDGVILSSESEDPTIKALAEADVFVFDFGTDDFSCDPDVVAFSCDPDVTNIFDAAMEAGAVIVGLDLDHDGSLDAMMIGADTMEFL